MGDHRNIIVEHDHGTSVALYTHWTGSRVQGALARALDRGRSRWNDPTYLTRIIFCDMITKADSPDIHADVFSETGFGIESFETGTTSYVEASPGYDLTVNPEDQTVSGDNSGTGKVYSFEDFIQEYL